ncbi:MAG: ice-binding family protein [Phycisphaerae bacterium]
MKNQTPFLLAAIALALCPLVAKASVVLGAAGNFAVLAGSTVTNTGTTTIGGGNVGVSPGTAITGLSTVTIAPPYATHAGDAVAAQAQTALTSAYNTAAGLTNATNLSGQDLGGQTLTPGVYAFSSSAALSAGTLTLNDEGNPNAQFVFQIGTTLTTGSGTDIKMSNGGQDPNIFWQVGSSATLGTGSVFEGHILALDSITLDTGANIIDGSALASTGAVTLDGNVIDNAVPEPDALTLAVLGFGLIGLSLTTRRLREHPRQAASTGLPR